MKMFDMKKLGALIPNQVVHDEAKLRVIVAKAEALQMLVASIQWRQYENLLTNMRQACINKMPVERRTIKGTVLYFLDMLRVSHRIETIDMIRAEIAAQIQSGVEASSILARIEKEKLNVRHSA